jgi:hypothetical protein
MISGPQSLHAYLEAIEEGAAQQYDKVQKKIATERTKFFEQIALLSGGAIVLSVSLLSTLFGKADVYAIPILICGWLALLLCLFSSLYRTLKYQPYMLEISMAHYMDTLAAKKLALAESVRTGTRVVGDSFLQRSEQQLKEEAAEAAADSKQRKERAEKYIKIVQRFEKIALSTFWLGALLLAVFAAYNVIRDSGQMSKDTHVIFFSRAQAGAGSRFSWRGSKSSGGSVFIWISRG